MASAVGDQRLINSATVRFTLAVERALTTFENMVLTIRGPKEGVAEPCTAYLRYSCVVLFTKYCSDIN